MVNSVSTIMKLHEDCILGYRGIVCWTSLRSDNSANPILPTDRHALSSLFQKQVKWNGNVHTCKCRTTQLRSVLPPHYRTVFRLPAGGELLQSAHTGSDSHPASYSMGIAALSPGVKRPCRAAANCLHLIPKLRMHGPIPPLSHISWHDA